MLSASSACSVQRFPFAASARVLALRQRQFETADGTSGIVRNVLLVIPALLMNVSACRWTRHAVARRERSPVRGTSRHHRLTKYAGPVKRHRNQWCDRLRLPDTDAAGQAAGFASNVLRGTRLLQRRQPAKAVALGRSTLTLLMFAWVPERCFGVGELDAQARTLALEVFPAVETVNPGLNAKRRTVGDLERHRHALTSTLRYWTSCR